MTQRNIKNNVDPDLPFDESGKVYHLACTRKDIADNFIFVGDPGRVEVVAKRFDEGSIIFKGSHREIVVITGTYKGVPVTCLSTGMGTDNCEIVMNEIHALKEYDHAKNEWDANGAETAKKVKIIRVGTCGSPYPAANVGELAVTRHVIGMDNTCRYYQIPSSETTDKLAALANATELKNAGGCYATAAHPDITNAIVAQIGKLESKRGHHVGITATGSGFYGCQGRVIGRFVGKATVPNLVAELGKISLPIPGEEQPEHVVNIEMESSAICCLSSLLGYRAGVVCAILAKRAGDTVEFAAPEVNAAALSDAINVALEAVISA